MESKINKINMDHVTCMNYAALEKTQSWSCSSISSSFSVILFTPVMRCSLTALSLCAHSKPNFLTALTSQWSFYVIFPFLRCNDAPCLGRWVVRSAVKVSRHVITFFILAHKDYNRPDIGGNPIVNNNDWTSTHSLWQNKNEKLVERTVGETFESEINDCNRFEIWTIRHSYSSI